jgi:hypothetical protein
VSIKGSPEAWFKRALAGQGPAGIVSPAALDLGRPLRLDEALALTLIFARDRHPRFDRAAARWVAMLTLQSPALSLGEISPAVVALDAVGDPAGQADALAVLEETLRRHSHGRALRALDAFDASIAG